MPDQHVASTSPTVTAAVPGLEPRAREVYGALALGVGLVAACTVLAGPVAGLAVAGAALALALCVRWFHDAVLVLVVVAAVSPVWLFVDPGAPLPLITPTRGLTFVLLVAAAINVRRGQLRPARWGLWPAVALWAAACAAGIPGSLDAQASMLRTLSEVVELAAVGYLVFVAFRRRGAQRVLVALSVAVAVNAVLALATLLGLGLDTLAEAANARFARSANALVSSGDVRLGVTRIAGTFQHPAFLGAFLAMTLPVVYALVVGSRGRARLLHAASLALGLVALVLTGTRAAWLAAAGALAVVLVAARGQVAVRRHLAVLCLAVAVLVTLPVTRDQPARLVADLLDTGSGATTTTTGYRLDLAAAVLHASAQRPVLGYGAGTFDQIGITTIRSGQQLALTSPDNHVLRVLAETGWVGLGAFTVLVGWAGVLAVRAVRRASPARRLPALAAAAGLAGFVAVNLTISALTITQDAVPAWILLGALLALGSPGPARPPALLPAQRRRPAGDRAR